MQRETLIIALLLCVFDSAYLKLADKRLGLLINFGAMLIKDGIFRVANGMPD